LRPTATNQRHVIQPDRKKKGTDHYHSKRSKQDWLAFVKKTIIITTTTITTATMLVSTHSEQGSLKLDENVTVKT
jgi:hypothetical protein